MADSMRFTLSCCLIIIVSCTPQSELKDDTYSSSEESSFQFTSTVEEVRAQIEKQPTDDIWWNVYGEDQAWNFKNLHRFMPTVNLYREGQVRMLQYNRQEEIGKHLVDTPDGKMTFDDYIHADISTVMGIVILKDGAIVYEEYPRQEYYEKPIYWSVTKVLVSAVLGILEDRGMVDVQKPIAHYIEELEHSSFGKIKIRNILDMANGLNCAEEYEDWESCYYQYSITVGDGYWTDESPENPYKFLATANPRPYGSEGTEFQYSGVNTFLLGWLIEELTGMPFQDALTKEIWRKIGAEADGSILAPRFGVPNTHGGLMARIRDVARFGLLYTPSYHKVSDERIISERIVSLILNDGNPKLWEAAFNAGSIKDDFSHSIYQWDQVYKNHDFFKGGWGGQGLLVNPDKDIVVVFTGYYKDKNDDTNFLPIVRQLLKGIYPDVQ